MDANCPDLTLAQAILRTIAQHTGRDVTGAEVYAFRRYVSVTVSFEDDGTAHVEFGGDEPADHGVVQ